MRGKTAKRIKRGTLRACKALEVTVDREYKRNKDGTIFLTENCVRGMYKAAKRDYKQIRKEGVAVLG